MKADIDELKANSTTYNFRLENVTSAVNEVKGDLNDLGNKMYKELQGLGNKMDRKSDKTDRKIDRAIYIFIAVLFLKGGFDVFMKPNQGKPKNPETAQMGK